MTREEMKEEEPELIGKTVDDLEDIEDEPEEDDIENFDFDDEDIL